MWKEILDGIDAVLFDLDGTIVDSMWIWKQIDIDYFSRFDLGFPDQYQREIEGLSFYETAQYTHDHYMPWISVEQLMDDWNKMAYDHYVNDVTPKENIRQFLEHLKRKGCKLGVATSNSKVLCNATLEKNGLRDYFDIILTGDECGAGKPAPDVYLNCAKALDVKPERCLVFEDLCNGIIAGKNAGMTVVTIYDEYSAYQWEDKCSKADHNITSYREITDEVC